MSNAPSPTNRTGPTPADFESLSPADSPATPGDSAAATPRRFDSTNETLAQDPGSLQQSIELSIQPGQPPANLPGYRIARPLGEGKYGEVWLAREQNTGKQVAIKFYSTRRGVDWSLLSREVEKLAKLYTSRYVVGLLAVGWDHDPPYYVMEYLENGSLARLLEQGPLRVSEAIRIVTRVAQGLVHAHGSGILHCDLKPANILLDKELEPRLCDFGQSRLVDEQMHSLGTLFYMAPEQADLKAIPDARWDVYAIGALLYHMLIGAPPYRTADTEERLRRCTSLDDRLATYQQIVRTSPRPSAHRQVPGVDPLLADLIDRCLVVNPSRRIPNAQAVVDKLAARERFRTRRPLIVLGLVLPLLLLVSLAPLAAEMMRVAVESARTNLTSRVLESNELSASLLADGISREIRDRLDELTSIADEDETRQLVSEYVKRPLAERGPLVQHLSAHKTAIDKRRRQRIRQLDASWFLTDARGWQRWHDSASDATRTIDESFAHRDYFHGQNREYSKDAVPAGIEPLRSPHISQIYQSTSTGRFRVALSVPVWEPSEDGQKRKVSGVLARTVDLNQLLLEYEQLLDDGRVDAGSRVIALADGRNGWKLLAHRWLSTNLPQLSPDEFEQLRLEPRIAAQLQQLVDGSDVEERMDRTADYFDPTGLLAPEKFGGAWMAAFSRVGEETGWVAIVQERKDQALAPVEDMQRQLFFYGVLAAGFASLLVAGTWWMVVRLLNDAGARRSRTSPTPRDATEGSLSLTIPKGATDGV